MIIHHMPQASADWWEVKMGVPSASMFDRIMTPAQCKPSGQQDDLIAELIAQLAAPQINYFSERGQQRPLSPAMAHGVTCEPEARQFYAMEKDVDVHQVGFCQTDDGRFGCSPDGLIKGPDGEWIGGLELKCPQLHTQAKYLISGELPKEYKCQVHGALIVTGLEWWDFLSFALPLEPLLIRVYPDEFTEKLREEMDRFWDRYQEQLERQFGAAAV